jgi:ATPase subunit of ABC transporter with duplicated ATPase domains
MRRRKTDFFRINKLKRTFNRQTSTFTFNIQYETAAKTQTQRTREVAEAFGLGTDQTQKFTILDNTQIQIRQNDIVLVTGDSGSGKSVLLKAIKHDLGDEAADTRDLTINPTEPIIETVGKNTTEAFELEQSLLKRRLPVPAQLPAAQRWTETPLPNRSVSRIGQEMVASRRVLQRARQGHSENRLVQPAAACA